MAPAFVPRDFASLVPWTCLLYAACVNKPPLGGPSVALICDIYVYLCGFYLRPQACIWPYIFCLDFELVQLTLGFGCLLQDGGAKLSS